MNINNSILKINAITTANSMRKKISYIKNYWNSKSNSGFDFKYKGSKISRNYWLFEPKCRNNAEITYTQRLQIASYFP